MTLGSEMDDAVNLLVLHELVERVEVADVHLDKLIVGFVLDVLGVGWFPCLRHLVEVDDAIVGILVHEEANDMRANEACTACNYDIVHIRLFLFIFPNLCAKIHIILYTTK